MGGGHYGTITFMRRLLPLLLLFACNGASSSPTGVDGVVPFVTVHREQSTGVKGKHAEIISRADVWQRTWDEIVSNRSPKPPLPAVDFEKNILIFAAMGETADACRSLVIDSVERRNGELLVSIKETRPPASCSCPPVTVQPVHVVSVPRAATGAAFLYRSVTEGNCGN
jgi:hypothetical protein